MTFTKSFLIILSFVVLFFASCDPLNDIIEPEPTINPYVWQKLGGINTTVEDLVINSIKNVGDMVIDSLDRIYFTDLDNNCIIRMDDIYGTNFKTYGTNGSGVDQFDSPKGLALDSSSRIYISDDNNDRIIRIDDMSGTSWKSYSISGNLIDVEIDIADKILILDSSVSFGRIIQIDDMNGTGQLVHLIPELRGWA